MKKHAILVTAHAKVSTLVRLLNELDDDRNDIYLHWNSDLTEELKELFFKSLKFANLYILPRHFLYWGSPEMIDVHYDFYRTASQKNYQYYHVITGQCMPIHSWDAMNRFFDENPSQIYMQVAKVKKLKWYLYSRFAYKQFFKKQRNKAIAIKSFFTVLNLFLSAFQKVFGVDYVKSRIHGELKYGFAWFSLPNEVMSYILGKEDWIKYCFKDSFAPDESYMQTLIWNSPYRNNIAVNPSTGRFFSCRYVSFEGRKFGSGHPRNIGDSDFNDMVSSKCMFARKFDYDADPGIIEKLSLFRKNEQ